MDSVNFYNGWSTKALALEAIAKALGLSPTISPTGRRCLIPITIHGKFRTFTSFDPEFNTEHFNMLLEWYGKYNSEDAKRIKTMNKLCILSTRYSKELIYESLRLIRKEQATSASKLVAVNG